MGEEIRDCREELINNICMCLMTYDLDIRDIKNRLYILFEPYEITSRCTELAELQEDRNEYLVKTFLTAKAVKGCTKRTLQYYRRTLASALPKIGKNVGNITADDIRLYLAVRQGRDHISKITAGDELRVLSSFFGYLWAEELIPKNPVLKVEWKKPKQKKKAALTDMEIEKLRMAANGLREKMVIEVLLSTGCRVSELVAIQLDDIDGNRVLVHGKGEKDRYCYLNAKALLLVNEYIKKRKDNNPYLLAGGCGVSKPKFRKGVSRKDLCNWWMNPELVTPDTHMEKCSVEQMTKRIAKRAGVEQANPHKFRRTCATLALRRGMPVEQVSKMLGHENLSTTQIYLDLTEDELAQAHKKYVV